MDRYTVHTSPNGDHYVFDTVTGESFVGRTVYSFLCDAEFRAAMMNTAAEWWRQ